MTPSSCLNELSCSSSTTIRPSVANGRNSAERAPTTTPHPALGDGAPGLAPLQAGQAGMPRRGQRAEAVLEALQPLRGERDLGQQHQHLPARRRAPPRSPRNRPRSCRRPARHRAGSRRRRAPAPCRPGLAPPPPARATARARAACRRAARRSGAPCARRLQQADRRHGLDHRRADAGEMRQLRRRHGRAVLQLLEHAAARGGELQRRRRSRLAAAR